jgi:hypothetical protein
VTIGKQEVTDRTRGCAVARTLGNQSNCLARHKVCKRLGGPTMPLTVCKDHRNAASWALSKFDGIATFAFGVPGNLRNSNLDFEI